MLFLSITDLHQSIAMGFTPSLLAIKILFITNHSQPGSCLNINMKNSSPALTHDEDFLYLQIAERLSIQIHGQVLKTGEKLPSVRALSHEQGISLSTAYKAYVQLEIKGL